MVLQQLPPNLIVKDLLGKISYGSLLFTSNGFPVQEELRPRVNHKIVSDPCQLEMGDFVELTMSIPYKFLIEYMK